jgi:hypothetical protein
MKSQNDPVSLNGWEKLENGTNAGTNISLALGRKKYVLESGGRGNILYTYTCILFLDVLYTSIAVFFLKGSQPEEIKSCKSDILPLLQSWIEIEVRRTNLFFFLTFYWCL